MSAREFVVPASHPCLPGHFPGNPVVPGVVVLDHVVAALEAMHGELGAVRLPQAKFLQPLRPGQRASIELEALPSEAMRRWRFRVEREGVVLTSGEIVASDVA